MDYAAVVIICMIAGVFLLPLPAVFAKAGLKEVNPDMATAIRTAIILPIPWSLVFFKGTGRQVQGFQKQLAVSYVISILLPVHFGCFITGIAAG